MQYKGLSDYPPAQLVKPVVDIARRAADAILEIYQSDFGVDKKEDNSPLTEADMAAHRTIVHALKDLTPDIPILSEESASVPYETRKHWALYWLVDPLDGTKEFVKRNGEFTVNIALIFDHQPVLGVVHVPVTNVGYHGAKDHGAFKYEADSDPIPIRTRKTVPDNIIVAGSRSHANQHQLRFYQALGEDAETINRGSSLKFCLVAEARVDVYARFGPTSEWDTAAAQCVVNEAGGDVTDMKFKSLAYNRKESIINPSFIVMGDKEFDWSPYLQGIKED